MLLMGCAEEAELLGSAPRAWALGGFLAPADCRAALSSQPRPDARHAKPALVGAWERDAVTPGTANGARSAVSVGEGLLRP